LNLRRIGLEGGPYMIIIIEEKQNIICRHPQQDAIPREAKKPNVWLE